MKIGVREIIFIVLLLTIPLMAWLLAFKPFGEERARIMAGIFEKQQKLEDLRLATAGIQDLDDEISKLSKAISFLESKLPSGSKEVDVILREVWEKAEDGKLVSKAVRTRKVKGDGRFMEQPILIELQGGFKQFYAFLLALERLPRITRLDELELDKDLKKEGEARARFTLSIFYERESTGPGGHR